MRDVAEDPNLGTYSDRGFKDFLLLINILQITQNRYMYQRTSGYAAGSGCSISHRLYRAGGRYVSRLPPYQDPVLPPCQNWLDSVPAAFLPAINSPRAWCGQSTRNFVQTVHIVCGLVCNLRLTSPQNQVSFSWTTKKRGAQGMVPPHSGTVGKTPGHPSIPQAVPVTGLRRDTLLAMRTRAEPPTTSLAVGDRPAHWKDKNRDHTHAEGTSRGSLIRHVLCLFVCLLLHNSLFRERWDSKCWIKW